MTQEQWNAIKERAVERYGNRPIEPYCRDTEFEETWYDIGKHNGYFDGAFDQDPISRADERKKVIEKACQWLLGLRNDSNYYDWTNTVEQFKQEMWNKI